MAGRFSRTYSRKRPQPAPPISQFDALVKEGSGVASNQPAATKTAGHIGKWGMTSFTSLRNINGGNDPSKRRLSGSESPSNSPSHTLSSDGISSFQSNGEGSRPSGVKPVITYKRRKFFKSRGAAEEPPTDAPIVDSAPSLATTSYVSTGAVSANPSSNSKGYSTTSKDFDSLLSSSRRVSTSTDAIDYSHSINCPATNNTVVDLPVESTREATLVRSTSMTESKSGNSGIKLKIFKSRNSKSSWSEDLYSSKVELPSDDSRSVSTSSSSASSPSSMDVNEIEKDSIVPVRQPPVSKVSDELIGKPRCSAFSNFRSSQSPIDSIFTQSCSTGDENSSLCLDIVSDNANINLSLDSSMEFGEIIDQRTGLPSSLYNTKPSSPCELSSPISVGLEKSLSSIAESSRQSASRSIEKEQTKNSVAVLSEVDTRIISPTSLNSTVERDHSTNHFSTTTPLENSYTYGKNGTRSYGNKYKSKQNPFSRMRPLENYLSKDELPLDVRNDGKDEITLKLPVASESTTNLPSRASAVPDLFSSGFDEDEIVDRTQLNIDSPLLESGADSNGPSSSEKNTQELEELPQKSCSSSSVTSASLSSIGKAASMPARVSHLRSTSSTLFKDSPSSASSLTKPSTNLPRKRSIFKSRVVQEDGGGKKRATYNHKWHSSVDEKDEDELLSGKKNASSSKSSAASSSQPPSLFDDFDFDNNGGATLKRVQSWSAQSTSSVLPNLDSSVDEGSQITSVKCNKAAKEYYTVIKNVKKLHQLQESGEFQEFNDDVEYFLDALRSSNSASTRCLAALNLAQKCMVPAFRMHLRAHATVCKFFRALQDAPKHPALSLCSAMVMFALSQDRLNMDLDRDSLELMLNLLDSDGGEERTSSGASGNCGGSSTNGTSQAMTEAMSKIRDLCLQLQKKGHAKHLDLDSLDTGTLAMETLLSLTSKRAGEWFKEELRELGGVDHLVRTVTSCVRQLVSCPPLCGSSAWDRKMADTFSKVERCLKVLENVTHQNESNQDYLMEYQSGVFATTLMDLYRLCHQQIPLAAAKSPDSGVVDSPSLSLTATPVAVTGQKRHAIATGTVKKKDQVVSAVQGISSALITSMKVLVNLTHNSRKLGLGSKTLGAQPQTYETTLSCLLELPKHLSADTKFEVMVLSCCLLLNLVEHSTDNRATLMQAAQPAPLHLADDDIFEVPATRRSKQQQQPHGAMRALVQIFFSCEASAKEHEAHTDQIIDRDLDQSQRKKKEDSKEDELEETVAKLLQKAGRHMEDTLIAAYTALLTGYCIMDEKDYEAAVREMLPEGHFRSMVAVLKKFLHFMNLTATTSLLRSLAPTQKVVRYMEKLDPSLKPSTSVAERERLEKEKRERGEYESEDEDLDCSDDQPPSDSLVDAFGF
ncbi:Wings apart-like protein [Trinorchestia longiramus]|nr:Wings apart-like protein [Trinorchestia longiramus]